MLEKESQRILLRMTVWKVTDTRWNGEWVPELTTQQTLDCVNLALVIHVLLKIRV